MIDQYFNIMPSRLTEIKEAMVGFDSTQTYLIGYNLQQGFFPLGLRDDMGMGFFATLLHHCFGISVEMAYPVLLSLMIAIGWMMAFMTYRKHPQYQKHRMMFHMLNTIIALFVFNRGDVYVAGYTASMILYYAAMSLDQDVTGRYVKWSVCVLLLVGLEMIRSKTGMAAVLSMLLLLWYGNNKIVWKQKLVLSVCLIFIFSLHQIVNKQLSYERNEWFLKNTTSAIDAGSGHPFWHSVYIGLGFVSNRHGIEYRDEIAFEKAKKIGGDSLILCSKPYEQIIKNEFFSLLKEDPWFVIKALGLKAIVVSSVFIFFLIPILYRKKNNLVFALIPFLAMYAAAGILVYPRINYLLGGLTLLIFVLVHVWFEPKQSFEVE